MIDLKHLSFSYEKLPILTDVTLSIAAKEFVGIFGPNGGGKTTFLKLLMGFLKPQQGSISLFGLGPKEARKKIGYVPQLAHFDKQFPISVLEVVLMGCLSQARPWGTLSKTTKEKARSALEKVGLIEHADFRFGALSGGQAQRALIARALVSEPELLILDEPTASVDVRAEREIIQLLLDIKGEITVLMVSHDMQLLVEHVDRLLCVNRTINTFSPQEICSHFALGLYHPPFSPSLVPLPSMKRERGSP